MKIKLSVSLILILILSVISCTQNDEENNDETSFSFHVSVKDTVGFPITECEVRVRNKSSFWDEQQTRPCTIIKYDLIQECNVQINIYDLNNSLVNILADSVQNAGEYFHLYNALEYDSGELIKGGSIILKCNMIATDISTNEILFEDTKFMCRYTAFYNADIGLLNSNGEFYTENEIYFPHLFDLPEMDRINEFGEIIGTFTLRETVEITIYDPVTETSQKFDRVVEQGENNFDLVWDSTAVAKTEFNYIPYNGSRSVEVSSFYALYIGDLPSIYWITQSELDNEYWNVYRGTNDNFTEAIHLNANNPVAGNGTTNNVSEYVFMDIDPVVENTTYWYWIEDVSTNGETEVHVPITLFIPYDDTPNIPDANGLHQNYPNPFN